KGAHLVVRGPVDVMARAEPAGSLDRRRQAHQRADDGDAVADQRCGEERRYGEEEDGEDRQLVLGEAREDTLLPQPDLRGAYLLKAVAGAVEDIRGDDGAGFAW